MGLDLLRIKSLKIENYGPFKSLEKLNVGDFSTFIGKNDVGKSFILRALRDLFFEKKPRIEENDVHKASSFEDNVVIEVKFDEIPKNIDIEDGIVTTLAEEMLLDENGFLRIKKFFPRSNLTKVQTILVVNDFSDNNYSELVNLKETDLNQKCQELEIEASRSGRGITNKSKRAAIREKAENEGKNVIIREMDISKNDRMLKMISDICPDFYLFEADTRLGVGETSFQKEFRPIIKTAIEHESVKETREAFKNNISKALQNEIDKIYEFFKKHTDVFTSLSVIPNFSWDKAVSFDIMGKDTHNIEISLEKRGSGLKRLLMVSFFQYVAERDSEKDCNCIFAVEEPENCLHPGLQRELIQSFRGITNKGGQILVTSHSPVFAGSSSIEDIALIIREIGESNILQYPHLEPKKIADELGIEPSDQITCYNACIFVEGPTDIYFLKKVAEILKDAGEIEYNFDDKNIGFIPVGGDNLKCWIDLKALSRLNRRFGVFVDSDKNSENDSVKQRKFNWKDKCEIEGGLFFITRKKELENYLHLEAIRRDGGFEPKAFDDFTDMKKEFGTNIYKAINSMNVEELLERDFYTENGIDHHELKDIITTLLELADIPVVNASTN
jgi:putative ATP-dependent endonuclease of the OLD family